MAEQTATARTPKDVPCPTCRAKSGSPCRRPSGHVVFGGGFHALRYRALEERSRYE